MYIERHHEEQYGEEHGDEANDDILGFVVNDENDAAAYAKSPYAGDNHPRAPGRHDMVVAHGVEDGDIPVHGNGQQTAHGGHHRNADRGVKHIVKVTYEGVRYHQELIVYQVYGDGLPGVGYAHQHVSNC